MKTMISRYSSQIVTLMCCVFSQTSFAEIMVFDSKVEYLTITDSADCSGELPDIGRVPGDSFSSGSVSFSIATPSTGLHSSDWTTLLEGPEIAIDNIEHLIVNFDYPITAAGFDFVEPSDGDPNCPFVDSEFLVTLYFDSQVVGSFQFNATNETAGFVGVRSTAVFNKLDIMEVNGSCDDEFFGHFYCTNETVSEIVSTIHHAVEICWTSVVGVMYQVQWCDSESQFDWQSFGDPIIALDMESCIFDSTRNLSSRLYRVIELPR